MAVVLPTRNEKDFDEIPESARKSLHFLWADRVDEVIAAALEPEKAKAAGAN